MTQKTNPDVEKAKQGLEEEEKDRITIYIPLRDADAIKLYALKRRMDVSRLYAQITRNFLAELKA